MKIKEYLLSLLFLTSLSYSQSLYKENTKINDSVDYFLEVAIFNKDDKKSFNKAIIYSEKAIEYAKEIEADKLELQVWDFNTSAKEFYLNKMFNNSLENAQYSKYLIDGPESLEEE